MPPSPKSQHIFKTAWSLELLLRDFSFYVISIKKSSVPPISPLVVAMATMQLFGLFWKTRITIVFQVFPPERNFLWDSLPCFGHPNTLRSLIIAKIRTVTMETVQIIICPNMVIDSKTTDKRHVSQSIMSILRHRHPLRCFVIVSYYILTHSSVLSLVIAPPPTLTASAVPASN